MKTNLRFKETIDECIEALELEIDELKTTYRRGNNIYDGFFIGKEKDIYLYFFKLDEEIYLMDDAPIRIKIKNTEIEGYTIYSEGFEILLALGEFIGGEIKSAKLYSDPWKLLVELQERLREIETNNSRNKILTQKLVEIIPKLSVLGSYKLTKNLGQNSAINKSMNDDIVFIWGPPGTGKTYTLANIALKSFLNGERVLILSHSNIAVDGAIEAIWKLMPNELFQDLQKNYNIFPITRYGYSRIDFIKNSPYFNSYNQALNLDDKIKEKIQELEIAIEDLLMEIRTSEFRKKENQIELIHLRRELSKLKTIVRNNEKHYIVPRAKIIATTISKAQIDSAIFEGRYDIVLLDEASMAYIPQSIYAASLTKERIIFIGDFRQLPPIAISEGELVDKWLKKDIFEFSKVKECVNNNKFHPNMTMLNEQRRMHPSISKFVNENIYNNLLKDHKSVINDKTSRESLSIIDTSLMASICRVDENKSRFNIFNAFISVMIAIKHYHEGYNSIGIITPYNAQSKLINNILWDSFPDLRQNISCATVHKFQGSEKDIIIFDTVDSYRLRRPGVLLTDDREEKSQRLINVAVTRAKEKFVLVSNMKYWDSRWRSGETLHQLFDYLKVNGEVFNYEKIYRELNNIDINDLNFYIPTPNKKKQYMFFKKLFDEIINSKSIYIFVPESMEGSLKLIEIPIKEACKNNSKVIIQTENINLIPDSLQEITIVEDFTWLPIIIIDEEIIYYGYPFIINNYIENNLLIRLKGKNTARNLNFKLNIKSNLIHREEGLNVSFKDFVEERMRCCKCKSPLTVRKSRRNKYFIGCTNYPNCTQTEMINKEIMNSYLKKLAIRCNECNGKMEARIGRYGLFIGCSNYPKCENTKGLETYV
ncbi:MAG: AAA family ATPase [Tissierellia bacterium]|nr:AAA family ATPase [Tissierellia bacterium]